MTFELETLIEATLFGAGRSMSVEELAVDLEVEPTQLATSLEVLKTSLKRRRGGALQLAEINGRWALEVKPKVAQHLPCNAKTDIPPKLLKSASLIAFHQPMLQSRLVELLGQRTYDHVRELVQLGLVERRRHGNTKRLSTTRRFSEVFGCPHTEKRKVRAWFREQAASLGLTSGGGERPMALNEEQAELPVEEENNFEGIAERAGDNEEEPIEMPLEEVAEEEPIEMPLEEVAEEVEAALEE
jgi:segregation and condensation protein B